MKKSAMKGWKWGSLGLAVLGLVLMADQAKNQGAAGLKFAAMGFGVYARSDTTVTYRFWIEAESAACADANPADNSCTVVLRPGENARTVNGH